MEKIKLSIYCFILVSLISSCIKEESYNSRTGSSTNNTVNVNRCPQFQNLHIKPMKTTYTCGDKVEFFMDTFSGAHYDWTGPGYSYKDYPDIYLTNVNIYNRGWYYVTIYYDSCKPIHDSVYIDIKLPQGTPNCTTTINTVTYSGGITIPTMDIRTVNIDTFYRYKIDGYNSYSDLSLTFNEFWIRNKLETGIYYTTTEDKINDKEGINKVFLENRYADERWFGEIDKPVYISYVNGKLTATFCSIPIKAVTSSGTILTSNASGNMTLP